MFLEVVNVDLVQKSTSETLLLILGKRSLNWSGGGTRVLLVTFLTLANDFDGG